MQRIDHDFRGSEERGQDPACGQSDAVGRSIRTIGRAFPGSVVQPAGQFVEALVQGAAQSNIQLLYSTTNRQDWKVAADRLTNQGQRRSIALGIVQCFGMAWFATILARVNV